MANTSLDVTGLDFDSIKSNLKTFLKSKPTFKDIDFEGSNISVLIDVLAYNTYLNSFYLNMVGSEMFLDTAQLRDSIVSHAKELGYVPRSFRSAVAVVNVNITPNLPTLPDNVVIPKNTTFTSKVGSNTYSFSTNQSYVINESENGVFTKEIEIYEGTVVSETFVVLNDDERPRYVISNPTVDVSSIEVTSIEDNGQVVQPYVYADSIYLVKSDSKVFYVQPAENEQYEIVFGNNLVGSKPKPGSVLVISYRAASGELPNGASLFESDGSIGGYTDVVVETVLSASGGNINEDIESIRINAPKTFTTQQRAVTTTDYETLLQSAFSEISSISAYGGEEVTPPEFGKVFVAVDISNADGIPESRKRVYRDFIKQKSPLSIDVEIVQPDILYVLLESTVSYNVNQTFQTAEEIRTSVIAAVQQYATDQVNGFKKTLRCSKLAAIIDGADESILSNILKVTMMKIVPVTPNLEFTGLVTFDQALEDEGEVSIPVSINGDVITEAHFGHALYSSPFQYGGRTCILADDSQGAVYIAEYRVDNEGTSRPSVSPKINIGSVNYATGEVFLSEFTIEDFDGYALKLYGTPLLKNITSQKNILLNVSLADLDIKAVGVSA
jgi:hypothetical protein